MKKLREFEPLILAANNTGSELGDIYHEDMNEAHFEEQLRL